MGRLRPEASAAAPASSTVCGICGLNMTQAHGWPAGTAVYHCEGQSKAGQPHHHHAPTWGKCWQCDKPLGCARCAARTREEAICWRCQMWGTREAFAVQGLLGGQLIEDYPAEWHDDYFAARSFRDLGQMVGGRGSNSLRSAER
jgi:hypothetical protein